MAVIFIPPKYYVMPYFYLGSGEFQRVPFGSPHYTPYSTDQGPNVAVTPTATYINPSYALGATVRLT